ncbi:MAG TPA: hypothetical protein VFG24_06645, partial [Nitrosopumilaceae archaeon]|nr:hypothetical protein [Nitrosopumilaceae archaeon]
IGFLNNAYADNMNMSDNMNANASMTMDQNKTLNENMTMNVNMNTNGNMSMTNVHKVLSPLEQFKSGTPAKSVQCNEGFALVIKIDDGSPACASTQIAQALIARGWGTIP